MTMIHIVGRTRPGNKNKLEKKNEFITNRPFYGCRLSDLTINWKGPHTINAATVGSTRDLISQKNMYKGNRLQGWYFGKNFSRHQHEKWVQSTELDIVKGSFCNLCVLALGWRYISSLHCADELRQERNSCPQLRSCFIGSGYVGVSKRFSREYQLCSLLPLVTWPLKWKRGWSWRCFDTDLTAFFMQIKMLLC